VTTLLNDWLYDGILAMNREGCFCVQKPTELWALAGYAPPTPTAREPDASR